MTNISTLRNDIRDYIFGMLGGGMSKVELDAKHYDIAIDRALRVFRQRTDNAMEESYGFLSLVEGKQEYVLDSNIMEVRQVFRRGVGSGAAGSATQFEPFEAAFVNTYLLQSGRLGGLGTYEMWSQYQELSAKMFGGYLNFYWEPVSKKITFIRNIKGSGEEVLLWLYNMKPDVTLLQDYQIQPWIEKYSLGMCKIMLGEARSKFATIIGPGGGTSLNGDALKAEGQQTIEECMEDIKLLTVGNSPLYWVMG